MVRAEFFREGGRCTGFTVMGHAMPEGRGGEYDLICAAVSSAVYLCCNTLMYFMGGCTARQGDNEITLRVKSDSEAIQAVLRGFHEHMREMSRQHPDYLRTISTN